MIRPDPSELQELVHTLHRQGAPWLPAGLGSRLHWGPSVQTAPTETTPLVLSNVGSIASLNRTLMAGILIRRVPSAGDVDRIVGATLSGTRSNVSVFELAPLPPVSVARAPIVARPFTRSTSSTSRTG